MEQLGRYEILDELGRGAMGVVYKARDPNIDRLVAIKVISPEAGMDPARAKELRERFQREARAAGRLSHPNIVTIFDASEDQGRAFLVMEFVEGTTLDSMVNAGHTFTLDDVAPIGMQVAQGLDYAHQNGIVHRDIKPANIMFTKSGIAKIADFGIARLAETSVTRTGLAVGTPNYMSPEQVAGHKVDGRSDQFSLAVMLYELLCGEKAFPGDTLTTVLYRIMQEDPRPIRQINPALPETVDAVLRKGMAKNPDDRYSLASDMTRDLQTLASGGSVSVAKAEPSLDATMAEGMDVRSLAGVQPRTRAASAGDATMAMDAVAVSGRPSRRPPWLLIGAGGIAALAIGIGAWLWSRPTATPQPVAAPVQAPAPIAEASKPTPAAPEEKLKPKPPQLQELILAKEVRPDGRPVGPSKQFAASDAQVALLARGSNLTEQAPVRVKWFDPDGKEVPPSGVPKLVLDGKGGLARGGRGRPRRRGETGTLEGRVHPGRRNQPSLIFHRNTAGHRRSGPDARAGRGGQGSRPHRAAASGSAGGTAARTDSEARQGRGRDGLGPGRLVHDGRHLRGWRPGGEADGQCRPEGVLAGPVRSDLRPVREIRAGGRLQTPGQLGAASQPRRQSPGHQRHLERRRRLLPLGRQVSAIRSRMGIRRTRHRGAEIPLGQPVGSQPRPVPRQQGGGHNGAGWLVSERGVPVRDPGSRRKRLGVDRLAGEAVPVCGDGRARGSAHGWLAGHPRRVLARRLRVPPRYGPGLSFADEQERQVGFPLRPAGPVRPSGESG